MERKGVRVIQLQREEQDHLLPKTFYGILVHRFLPVLSLTYVASILGIAAGKGDMFHYIFEERSAYTMSLFIVLWVSGPAVIWVLLNESLLYQHVADLWYKILAGLMILTISFSYFLFPEGSVYGLRQYFALSIPVFIIIYILFIKGCLPKFAAYPLNAMGFCALLYGAAVNVLY